jgi:hypothetical protein
MKIRLIIPILVLLYSCNQEKVYVTDKPDTKTSNDYYVSNKAPLTPNPFIKLPIGAIKPGGWLKKWLELERDGMIGNMNEVSPWLQKTDNGWLTPDGTGKFGWEELPYWLKGYGDLGYVLKDEKIINEAKFWLDASIKYQRQDGFFGPKSMQERNDYWPNMVMLNCLQTYYEATNDSRVLPFMLKFFKYLDGIPEENLLPAYLYWPYIRGGDMFQSIIWTYNRTGEKWLIELAEKIYKNTFDWADIQNWHGVNMAQGFRAATQYYQISNQQSDYLSADKNWNIFRKVYGQFPGGMYAADENCRIGFTDPRNGTETCSFVEFMNSAEQLISITGDLVWADRLEDVAFNSFPAALTPDFKGLHYITPANISQLDEENRSPEVENRGCLFTYSPHTLYRCCQHNVSHGWPYMAEHIWYATAGNGLAAMFYSESEVKAKAGNGTEVTINETTSYPYDENIQFAISAPKDVTFPLYLRIPAWCKNASITINGSKVNTTLSSGKFAVIERNWKNGDKLSLTLPMDLSVTTWEKNKNSVSVNRGPLTYSLKIKENWTKREKGGEGNDKWPEMNVMPDSPWNYGLVFNPDKLNESFEVIKKNYNNTNPSFASDAAPIELKVKAKKIPAWQKDQMNFVGILPKSPVKSAEPEETVTLIPMGFARLRISSFPVIAN